MKESRKLIYDAIDRERNYQAEKHLEEELSVGEFILIIEDELREAKEEWNKSGNKRALEEILQIAATAVAAIEQHGVQSERS
jgi:Ni,Fe-hydrogenase I small subunit